MRGAKIMITNSKRHSGLSFRPLLDNGELAHGNDVPMMLKSAGFTAYDQCVIVKQEDVSTKLVDVLMSAIEARIVETIPEWEFDARRACLRDDIEKDLMKLLCPEIAADVE